MPAPIPANDDRSAAAARAAAATAFVPPAPPAFAATVDQPTRILIERIGDGALTLSAQGNILYCNLRFAAMLGVTREQVIGRTLATFASPNAVQALDTLLAQAAMEAGESELSFESVADGTFPARVWAGALTQPDSAQDDGVPGDVQNTTQDTGQDGALSLLVTVTDLTAQREAAEFEVAARFARSVLEQAADAIVVCDTQGRITQASFAADRLIDLPLTGLSFAGALPLCESATFTDSEDSCSERWLQYFLEGESAQGVEVQILQTPLKDRHFLLSGAPLTDTGEGIVGCIVTLTDITEQKRAEEKQTALVAELNHRVKNILAIVRSIASQTVLTTATLETFKESFDGRLRALALAHDILTRIRWGEVELRDLVTAILAPFRGFYAGNRVHIDGTFALIPSHAIVPLAMVFHELSTNAAKFGALSVAGATLDVTWEIARHDESEHIVLHWRERNVPATAARGTGFGEKLIARVVSYDLHGEVELNYREDGAHGRIDFPLECERPSTFAS